jgi:hypothetical protein
MKRKYRVVGALPVLGHEPGAVFEASLPKDQEALLLSGRSIERVVDAPKKETSK